MLRIYTGNSYKVVEGIPDVTYMFPENSKSAWDQIEWVDSHLEEFKTQDVTIVTFSPYIMNYMNLLIAKDIIDFDNIEVEEYDEYISDDNDVSHFSIKITDDKQLKKMIDTRSLSDPITWIYSEYNKIIDSKGGSK